jgi:hypothetical protein
MIYNSMRSIPLMLISFLMLSACEADRDNSSADSDRQIDRSDFFTGMWVTPPPYDAYEKARLSVRVQDGGITGVLRYARFDSAEVDRPDVRMSRFFWDGQLQGRSALISIRDEEGNAVGQARLALDGGELSVQLLEPAAELPGLFILHQISEEG